MTLARSPIKRHARLAQKRAGGQRRSRHPMPLPGSVEPEPNGEPVRRGPQHLLCQRTACCVCFALWWRRVHGERDADGRVTAPDWTQLPPLADHVPDNDSHHEPEGIHAEDSKTVPLCHPHHMVGFYARHTMGPKKFWGYFLIRWEDVRDEMRRRVALQNPLPVVDATASETTR